MIKDLNDQIQVALYDLCGAQSSQRVAMSVLVGLVNDLLKQNEILRAHLSPEEQETSSTLVFVLREIRDRYGCDNPESEDWVQMMEGMESVMSKVEGDEEIGWEELDVLERWYRIVFYSDKPMPDCITVAFLEAVITIRGRVHEALGERSVES